MDDGPISGGIDRQMVGQTNQPTDRLTQTDRDIQTDSLMDRQTIGWTEVHGRLMACLDGLKYRENVTMMHDL